VKLENTFTVPVPVDTAWQVLLDVERIAPCMPGATLTGQDGDTFTGKVKVKLGPISLTYGGTATITSQDEASHVAVIEATGKETRGSGTAKATITARLNEENGSTEVAVETDLTITGKPAQFGRGVLAEVSGKLITQFADCLAGKITADGAAGAAADTATTETSEAAEPAEAAGEVTEGSAPDGSTDSHTPAAPAATVRPVSAPPEPSTPDAIDLLGTAGGPVLKRLAPLLAVVAVVLAILLIRRRR
jgi:carbon monoxide dehydrogenase subunit G